MSSRNSSHAAIKLVSLNDDKEKKSITRKNKSGRRSRTLPNGTINAIDHNDYSEGMNVIV